MCSAPLLCSWRSGALRLCSSCTGFWLGASGVSRPTPAPFSERRSAAPPSPSRLSLCSCVGLPFPSVRRLRAFPGSGGCSLRNQAAALPAPVLKHRASSSKQRSPCPSGDPSPPSLLCVLLPPVSLQPRRCARADTGADRQQSRVRSAAPPSVLLSLCSISFSLRSLLVPASRTCVWWR